MRLARVGFLAAIGALLAVAIAGPAPAATTTSAGSFKVVVSPEYWTGGEASTSQVTVTNTSSTTLGSLTLTSPPGFTAPKPTAGTRHRGKARIHGATLSLDGVSLKPGSSMTFSVTATAPTKCGRADLHWTSHAFQGKTESGPQFALDARASSLVARVLCPAAAACGDGGPPCSTKLVTANSTYAVISDASSGTLRQTVNVGGRLRCGAYRFRDPNWYDSVVVPPGSSPPTGAPSPIHDNVTYRIRNATAKGIGFCLGAGYEFTTRSGGKAKAGTLPNGNPGFIGLLPMCTKSKPPCISSVSQRRDRSARLGSDALMKIQIPETGDPWGGA
jgi:hypothetical protein